MAGKGKATALNPEHVETQPTDLAAAVPSDSLPPSDSPEIPAAERRAAYQNRPIPVSSEGCPTPVEPNVKEETRVEKEDATQKYFTGSENEAIVFYF